MPLRHQLGCVLAFLASAFASLLQQTLQIQHNNEGTRLMDYDRITLCQDSVSGEIIHKVLPAETSLHLADQ
jgi:hypothetical protein